MAIITYTVQLEQVQAAITAILGGAQSHSIKDRSYTLADLQTLFDAQTRLMPLATAEGRTGGSGIRVRQVVPIE